MVALGIVLGGLLVGSAPQPATAESSWRRLAGPDRFATAAAIASEAFPTGSAVVYLARADVLADALAAGTLTDGPILLVRTTGPVPPPTLDAISELDPERVIALGGPRAVSSEVLRAAAGARATDRLSGADRHGTAVAISKRAFPNGASTVYLTIGEIDAIVAGSPTAGPILTVLDNGDPFHSIPEEVQKEIARLAPRQFVRIGGRINRDFFPHPLVDVSGRDRIETALAVALHQFGRMGVPRIYVANADTAVDAVAAGALSGGPVLLNRGCGDLDPRLRETVRVLDPVEVVGLGGPGVVCDHMLDQLAGLTRPALGEPGATAAWLPAGWNQEAPGAGPTLYDRAELHAWSGDGRHLLVRRTTNAGRLVLTRIGLDTSSHRDIEVPTPWGVDFDNQLDADFLDEPHASLSTDGMTAWLPVGDGRRFGVLAVDVASGTATLVAEGRVSLLRGGAAVIGTRVVDLAQGSTWNLADASGLVDVARDASWVARESAINHRDGTTTDPTEADAARLVAVSQGLQRTLSSDGTIRDLATGRTVRLPSLGPDGKAQFSDDGSRLLLGLARAPTFDHLAPMPPYGDFAAPAAADQAPWPGGPILDAERHIAIVVDVDGALAHGPIVTNEDLRVVSGSSGWPHVWWGEFDPTNAARFAYEAVQDGLQARLPHAAVLLAG